MAPFHTYGEHKSILYRYGKAIILSSCIAKQWKTNPGHNKWREKYNTCKTQHKTQNQTNIERTNERQGIQDITQDVKPKHDISWFTFGFVSCFACFVVFSRFVSSFLCFVVCFYVLSYFASRMVCFRVLCCNLHVFWFLSCVVFSMPHDCFHVLRYVLLVCHFFTLRFALNLGVVYTREISTDTYLSPQKFMLRAKEKMLW